MYLPPLSNLNITTCWLHIALKRHQLNLNNGKMDIKEDIDELDWNDDCLKSTKTDNKYKIQMTPIISG